MVESLAGQPRGVGGAKLPATAQCRNVLCYCEQQHIQVSTANSEAQLTRQKERKSKLEPESNVIEKFTCSTFSLAKCHFYTVFPIYMFQWFINQNPMTPRNFEKLLTALIHISLFPKITKVHHNFAYVQRMWFTLSTSKTL